MIKKTIGASYRSNEKDVLKVKTILNKYGFYETPSYGLTSYPDELLFKSIKSFQKDHDLEITGIIRPSDEMDMLLDYIQENPSVKSPILRCTQCGAPHGGSKGDLCPDCDIKR